MVGDPELSEDAPRGKSRLAWALGVVVVVAMIALLVFNLLV